MSSKTGLRKPGGLFGKKHFAEITVVTKKNGLLLAKARRYNRF